MTKVMLAVLLVASGQAVPPDRVFFTADGPLEDLRNKQAVIETDQGTIVLDLLADAAPNHVAYFMKLAEEGTFDGTVFDRVIQRGIIQGGDPISADPARRDEYGTGGLGHLQSEIGGESHTRGAVSAVLVPGDLDSAGAQFFICVSDQLALDGQYTIFARVVEGINVVQTISEAAVDAGGRAVERLEMHSVVIRDTPPPEPIPFLTETVAELAGYHAVLETSMGEITMELLPDVAPKHVRHFLRLATLGIYDDMTFHRIVPGFVIQTGHLPTRAEPLNERQERHIRALETELSDTPHVRGIVSMARSEDTTQPTISFFIVTGDATALDRLYTVFGRITSGLDIVDLISASEVDGETPVNRIDLHRIRIQP